MKSRASLFALSFSAGLLALSSTGCSTFSRTPSVPDASRPVGGKSIDLLQLRETVKSTRVALNRTTDALNRIPSAPTPQEAYTAFSNELASFKKLSAKLLQDSADVRNRGNTLFAEWDREAKSIKNPDIRAVAEERRAVIQDAYASMITPLLSARIGLTETMSDLTDMQKALALDLTGPGVAATAKIIERVDIQSANTAKSLDALSKELDKIVAALPAPTVTPIK
jgi:poly-gamma-glutamate capsule biosynthesis protein CapA/YwtB (metallophosphatase superfamily)